MDEEAAKKRFAKYLWRECPDCKAQVGVLCKSNSVWIHLDRMKLDPDFKP